MMKSLVSDSDRAAAAKAVSFAKKVRKSWKFVGLAMLVTAFVNPSTETAAEQMYKSAKSSMSGRSLCMKADRLGDVKCYYSVDKFLLSEFRTADVFKNSIKRKNLIFVSIFQYSSSEIRENLISEAENTIKIGSDYSSYYSSQQSRNPNDFDVCRRASSINCPEQSMATIQGRSDPAVIGIFGLVFAGELKLD